MFFHRFSSFSTILLHFFLSNLLSHLLQPQSYIFQALTQGLALTRFFILGLSCFWCLNLVVECLDVVCLNFMSFFSNFVKFPKLQLQGKLLQKFYVPSNFSLVVNRYRYHKIRMKTSKLCGVNVMYLDTYKISPNLSICLSISKQTWRIRGNDKWLNTQAPAQV